MLTDLKQNILFNNLLVNSNAGKSMTDGINSRFLALEEKERASRVLQIKYIIRPTVLNVACQVLLFLTGSQPKHPPNNRFRSSNNRYLKCTKVLKMEIADFRNRGLFHFSSAQQLDLEVEQCKQSIIDYPDARFNVSRHIADSFLIIALPTNSSLSSSTMELLVAQLLSHPFRRHHLGHRQALIHLQLIAA